MTRTELITRETAMELAENAGFEHVNHIKFRGRYNKCTVNEKFEIDCFQRICELAYQKALNDTLEADAVATTAPAQQSLTDAELDALYDKIAKYQEYGAAVSGWYEFARAIETAHGIGEKK